MARAALFFVVLESNDVIYERIIAQNAAFSVVTGEDKRLHFR